MTPQAMASSLAVWSKRKISYAQGLDHAKHYLDGTLGEGVIKEYFKTLYIPTTTCKVPMCINQTQDNYCTACNNMIPGSVVVQLLATLGEFLCGRKLES